MVLLGTRAIDWANILLMVGLVVSSTLMVVTDEALREAADDGVRKERYKNGALASPP